MRRWSLHPLYTVPCQLNLFLFLWCQALFPHVGFPVLLQGVVLRKGFVAHAALVRPLARVYAVVPCQCRRVRERLAAHLTPVRLLARVHQLVTLQVGRA